jgi:hypothetical protein
MYLAGQPVRPTFARHPSGNQSGFQGKKEGPDLLRIRIGQAFMFAFYSSRRQVLRMVYKVDKVYKKLIINPYQPQKPYQPCTTCPEHREEMRTACSIN